jgi:hypothetical protein
VTAPVKCFLCVGVPGPKGCRRCGGTGVDPGVDSRPARGLPLAVGVLALVVLAGAAACSTDRHDPNRRPVMACRKYSHPTWDPDHRVWRCRGPFGWTGDR